MSRVWKDWVRQALERREDAELLRDLRPLEPVDAVHVRADGRPITLFSSNDYLGLSHHPAVRQSVEGIARREGMGPRGSPLICGYTTEHEALERELSELEGTEATLLFPSGFAANLAVMTALAGPEVTIFSDGLNHASIIDGCRLGRRGGATLEVYQHADPDDLERKLVACESDRKVVVTDSVFSMDGDLAPLDRIVEVKDAHDALLVVDEAHGTLVFGDSGAGATEHFGVGERVDVNVGTLSKAFGSLGGFVSTTERLHSWILNNGRSYIYSTAPPLPVVAASRASMRAVRENAGLRERLWDHVDFLSDALQTPLDSPIVPIMLGTERRALEVADGLMERGIHATAIRPPTVPEGTCRIRVTLSAAHQREDIVHLVEALEELGAL